MRGRAAHRRSSFTPFPAGARRCWCGHQSGVDSFEPSAQSRRAYLVGPAQGQAKRLLFFVTIFCRGAPEPAFWSPLLPSDQIGPPKLTIATPGDVLKRGLSQVRACVAHRSSSFTPSRRRLRCRSGPQRLVWTALGRPPMSNGHIWLGLHGGERRGSHHS